MTEHILGRACDLTIKQSSRLPSLWPQGSHASSIVLEGHTRFDHFLDVVIDTMIDGLIVVDKTGRIRTYNRACERIFGYTPSEVLGHNLKMLLPRQVRYEDEDLLGRFRRGAVDKLEAAPHEFVGQRKNGETVPISVAVGEARLGEETIFVGIIRDLSAQKASEANLRQAQRLDAIGQLTGGIAHDFNNILMVIMGMAEELADGLCDRPEHAPLLQIIEASQRAADLTARLLAFARKQPLKPKVSAVDQLVGSIAKMLARTLGEHISIDLEASADTWPAAIDRAQFEAALINLCINARDAMPDGGRLKIETRNVTLDQSYAGRHADVAIGDYVMIAVTDTGTGIPKDQLDRVFEPFFTTKEVGRGTGLGLSMVYGFAKQSEGHIEIASEVGRGTTVRLYLPGTREPAAATDSPTDGPPKGTERILVVEDDPSVRFMTASVLRRLGYHVGEAAGGDSALTRMREDPQYQLLLTDVLMPGPFNGKTLAQAARLRQPGLRVMFMSGYAQSVMVRDGKLDPDVHLLNKPFRKLDLARAVRTILDAA
jgi:PAS domain S-box-containing protein